MSIDIADIYATSIVTKPTVFYFKQILFHFLIVDVNVFKLLMLIDIADIYAILQLLQNFLVYKQLRFPLQFREGIYYVG